MIHCELTSVTFYETRSTADAAQQSREKYLGIVQLAPWVPDLTGTFLLRLAHATVPVDSRSITTLKVVMYAQGTTPVQPALMANMTLIVPMTLFC